MGRRASKPPGRLELITRMMRGHTINAFDRDSPVPLLIRREDFYRGLKLSTDKQLWELVKEFDL